MVLPIGDSPNPRGVPLVTYALIVVNVAVYVLISLPLSAERPAPTDPRVAQYVHAMAQALDPSAVRELVARLTSYDLFVFAWGFRPAAPSPLDLVASMFLHGGFLHLAGNMLFLWIYGDNVEARLGPVAYLCCYLACGVAAALFFMAGDPDSPIPMVGASGAISGVLGFYFLWFPRNEVRLLWMLPPFLMHVIEVPARLVLGIYLVMDNLLPYLIARETSGVAHGAHIGGFVAGLAAAWVMDRRALATPPTFEGETPAPGSTRRTPDAASTIAAAITEGRMRDAAERYLSIPVGASRSLLSPEHSLLLARWLRDAKHPEAALIVARRHLRDFPRGPGVAEAHLLAGQLLMGLEQPTPAYQHFLSVIDVGASPDVEAGARDGLAAIEALQKHRVRRPVHRLG
ncbi:MAG TPA: rhomboid family intramembrane serine protease [Candidatus Binatia bacterium]|jgi:membrane associated rhomboid family serine protease|nr:rhomboid family intramembrane serine protease [Candidatus Binatia bacterium]